MPLVIDAQPIPLAVGTDGVIRVAGSRVPLDTVVHAFHQGATAEEIAQQFPSIGLPDIYAVLAYYLSHRQDVTAYLERRATDAARVRAQNEALHSPVGLRERLLARKV